MWRLNPRYLKVSACRDRRRVLRVKDRNLIWPWSEEVHAAGWRTTQLLWFHDSSEGEFWKQENRFSFVVIISFHSGYESLFSLCWRIVTEYFLIILKRALMKTHRMTRMTEYQTHKTLSYSKVVFLPQSNDIIFVSVHKLHSIRTLFVSEESDLVCALVNVQHSKGATCEIQVICPNCVFNPNLKLPSWLSIVGQVRISSTTKFCLLLWIYWSWELKCGHFY